MKLFNAFGPWNECDEVPEVFVPIEQAWITLRVNVISGERSGYVAILFVLLPFLSRRWYCAAGSATIKSGTLAPAFRLRVRLIRPFWKIWAAIFRFSRGDCPVGEQELIATEEQIEDVRDIELPSDQPRTKHVKRRHWPSYSLLNLSPWI